MLGHKRSAHRVISSVLLTHFTAKISPIRVNGTLFGRFSIIRQSNSYLYPRAFLTSVSSKK